MHRLLLSAAPLAAVAGILVGDALGPGSAGRTLVISLAGVGAIALVRGPTVRSALVLIVLVGLGCALERRALHGLTSGATVDAARARADVVVTATLVDDPDGSRWSTRALARVESLEVRTDAGPRVRPRAPHDPGLRRRHGDGACRGARGGGSCRSPRLAPPARGLRRTTPLAPCRCPPRRARAHRRVQPAFDGRTIRERRPRCRARGDRRAAAHRACLDGRVPARRHARPARSCRGELPGVGVVAPARGVGRERGVRPRARRPRAPTVTTRRPSRTDARGAGAVRRDDAVGAIRAPRLRHGRDGGARRTPRPSGAWRARPLPRGHGAPPRRPVPASIGRLPALVRRELRDHRPRGTHRPEAARPGVVPGVVRHDARRPDRRRARSCSRCSARCRWWRSLPTSSRCHSPGR